MLSGGNVNDFYLNIHNDTVLDYKRRNDAIKQDRSLDRESRERARQGLEIEMGKYKNSLDQEQEVMTTLLNNSANDRIFTDVGSPEAKAWNSILKDLVDGTNNSNRTIENGKIMYTVNGEKLSLRDIKKGLSAHDPEFNTQFQGRLNNIVGKFVQVQKLGAEIKQDDLVRMKKSLFTGVTSMDQIRNLANTPFGKENHSFEEIFHAQAKASGPGDHEMINTTALETIHNELDRLGGVDMDGDGDVDEKDKKDYRNAENAVKLIEEIKKDKFLYRDLVVGHIMETAVKDVYSVGMMQRVDAHRLKAEEAAARKGKSGKSDNTGFLSTRKGVYSGNLDRSFSYNVAKNMYDQIKLAIDGKDASFLLGGTKYQYDKNNDNWTVGEDGFGNSSNLIKNLGIENDPDFSALMGGASEITEESKEQFVPKVYQEQRTKQTPGEFNYGDEFDEKTGLDIKYLDLDDDALAKVLNERIPKQGAKNKQGYYFDAPDVMGAFSDYIALYDGNDNRVGDFKIKTNQGLDGNKDNLNNLMQILKQYGLLDNFKSLPKPNESGYLNIPGAGQINTAKY